MMKKRVFSLLLLMALSLCLTACGADGDGTTAPPATTDPPAVVTTTVAQGDTTAPPTQAPTTTAPPTKAPTTTAPPTKAPTTTVHVHEYDLPCSDTCVSCGAVREAPPHQYENDCDDTCDLCEAQRDAGHSVDDEGYCEKCMEYVG